MIIFLASKKEDTNEIEILFFSYKKNTGGKSLLFEFNIQTNFTSPSACRPAVNDATDS